MSSPSPTRRARREVLGLSAAASPAVDPKTGLPMRGGGPEVYTKLGARPYINCTAITTIYGGSAQRLEVIEAIRQASYYHVNLDELMAAVGPRIARLLDAEAAHVSSGAAGAVTCATLACIAGGDPEKIQQVPDTRGLKNEVLIPSWSRIVYDQAIRSVGARIVEVTTAADLRKAFGPKTAMAAGLIHMGETGNPFTLEEYVGAAHEHGVPVLIDAADGTPHRPNPFLRLGVDLVAYSGGKIVRGPQTAGLLLGRKDLIAAAFTNSAPHHTFARAMKVSKEEIMGLLAAVEALASKPDRSEEDELWRSWYRHIIDRVSQVRGVTGRMTEGEIEGNYVRMSIDWDPKLIGLTSGDVGELLLSGKPRIMAHAGGDGHSLGIRAAALYPGDEKLVAERLHEILRDAPGPKPSEPQARPAVIDVSGHWDVWIEYSVGSARHKLFLTMQESQVSGEHIGRIASGAIRGRVSGREIEFSSSARYEGTSLRYHFTGRARSDQMSGEVDLGEYGTGRWKAQRLT